MSDQENDNIYFFFDESVSDNENNNDLQDEELSKILKELDNIDLEQNDNLIPSLIFYYEINYNIKQLLLICEYYKIAKDLRINKSNKMDIINTLVLFENNEENMEIVLKRKQLWFYINELKNDKFMKKYVLWN
jgi:hypothetical protein